MQRLMPTRKPIKNDLWKGIIQSANGVKGLSAKWNFSQFKLIADSIIIAASESMFK